MEFLKTGNILMDYINRTNSRNLNHVKCKTIKPKRAKNAASRKPKANNIGREHKALTKADLRAISNRKNNPDASEKEDLIHKFVFNGTPPAYGDVFSNLGSDETQINITTGELLFEISRLPRGKSPGKSGVRNEMIQLLPHTGIELILMLFRKVISRGCIPTSWNILVIKPIPKPDGSFRPISLTEHMRKLFEILILKRLNIKLVKQQGGFVPQVGTTEHALILDNALRKGNGSLIVMTLDISKAYDKVCRKIMYEKLKHRFNIKKNMMKILFSLNENNTCHMRFGVKDQTKKLTLGLPQGSVLSPTLFNTFIDDIVDNIDQECCNNILLYADDIVIFHKSSETLLKMLKNVERHSEVNKYTLNAQKCAYMGPGACEFFIGQSMIPRVPKIKYMGYVFNLKCCDKTENIKHASKEIYINSLKLERMLNHKDSSIKTPKDMLNYYKTYMRVHLDYMSRVLCSSKEFISAAERIQKKSLKRMARLDSHCPTILLYGMVPIETYAQRNELLVRTLRRKAEKLRGTTMFKEVYDGSNTKNMKFIKQTMTNISDKVDSKLIRNEMISQNIFSAFGFGINAIGSFENTAEWWDFSIKVTNNLSKTCRETNLIETRKNILSELSKKKKN